MYIIAQRGIQNYEQTLGNEQCKYMDWNLQNTYNSKGERIGIRKTGNEDDDTLVKVWFERWREGRTGFPWIDALMRQLKQDGWIHQYPHFPFFFPALYEHTHPQPVPRLHLKLVSFCNAPSAEDG